jgi:membrane protein YqaA with SNARE-associated domain
LLFTLAITASILLGWDEIERLGMYGYPAIFVVSLLSSATVVLPAPGIALVVAAGSTLNPVAVGLAAGLGAAIGEMTGYMAGYSGQTMFQDRPIYKRIELWMKKSGPAAIFFLAAVPNPVFDVGGLIAGFMRMPVWLFFTAALMGKSLRYILLASLGYLA